MRIGTDLQGREILALKVTQGARQARDGKRPAVLFSATQHAREWIAAETDRRLMNHYVRGWTTATGKIRKLLDKTELWFVPIMNPDGYQYTFDNERLWRKNLRDNDGDGETTIVDGVDPNRNYPEHFKYDEEGSSKIFSSQTYRGPSGRSEPETKAIQGLYKRVGFSFNVNYHSAGEWLLYPEGWQVGSPTADDPIYYALSGNLDEAGDPGLPPGAQLRRAVRDQRRGQRLRAQRRQGAGVDPRAGRGVRRAAGSCSPTTRRWSRPSSSGTCRSPSRSRTPRRTRTTRSPRSGIKTKPFYIQQRRPVQGGHPGRELRVQVLLRRPAAGRVLAKRTLGR